MAYTIGPISGCHLNPAVTVGLAAGGRFPMSDVVPYIVAQVIGGIVGGGRPLPHRQRRAGLRRRQGFCGQRLRRALARPLRPRLRLPHRARADDDVPVHHHGLHASRAPVGFAPIAIGLGLTLIHLISIPVTNTSVNPARSTGPALFAGAWAIGQLWLFWVAPLLGGALGGIIFRTLSPEPSAPVVGTQS